MVVIDSGIISLDYWPALWVLQVTQNFVGRIEVNKFQSNKQILGVNIVFYPFDRDDFFLYTKFTDDIKTLVLHSKGVYNFMGMIWWHIPVFHFSVIMQLHSLQKLVSDFDKFLQLCAFKNCH